MCIVYQEVMKRDAPLAGFKPLNGAVVNFKLLIFNIMLIRAAPAVLKSLQTERLFPGLGASFTDWTVFLRGVAKIASCFRVAFGQ